MQIDCQSEGTRRSVGIGELIVSSLLTEILMAPNLGSCLGVAVFDPVARCGGVVHCLLPLSQADPEKAKKNPALYVDTGVSLLLEKVIALGGEKKRLLIGTTGAGNINDEENVFQIGKKNHTIFRKVMWKNGLLTKGEHVGKSYSTTLILDLQTGEASVKFSAGVLRLY